jgi:hypothetical protein
VTHAFIRRAVYELKQLDGELDVPDSAGAQLHVFALAGARLPSASDGMILNARLHLPDACDVLGCDLFWEDQRARPFDELVHHRFVSGGGSRLDQGLELPRLGPLLVVIHVAVERPNQRAAASFGSEVRVDDVGATLGCELTEFPEQQFGGLR